MGDDIMGLQSRYNFVNLNHTLNTVESHCSCTVQNFLI